LLYGQNGHEAPAVRSVTLVLSQMDGVAYTKGIEIDSEHKEIHLSGKYLLGTGDRAQAEIWGVTQHEMVHCFQYNGKGQAPGGLIEGIADWVRLRCGLAPPHWSRGGDQWDTGYEKTAYFLDFLEVQAPGFVRRLNMALKEEYDATFWERLTGQSVEELWTEYKRAVELDLSAPPNPVPTHRPRPS